MKRTLLSTLVFSGLALSLCGQTKPAAAKKAEPLDLKVHINGLSGGYLLLAHYYADQNRILDTGIVDTKGNATFKRDSAAPGGIYLIVLPSKRPFEVILADEQKFSVDVPDTNDIVNTIKVTGSKENTYFYEYQRFVSGQQKKVMPLQEAMKKARETKNQDSIALLTKQITAIDSTVKKYKRDYYRKNHPETFMAKVLSAMDEPDAVPYDKAPRKADGTIDSTFNYWNMRNHYWDGMDFTDDRMIRTPVFANKMNFYLDKLTPQHPDTIAAACDWLIDRCKPSKELFRYALGTCTYKYESSKIMGFDAVFVHLVNRYYKTDQAWWITKEQQKKIVDRADKVAFTLLGKTAVNLLMKDTLGKVRPLHSVNADYTIVIFWDPTCSHCKHDIPALKVYYDSLRNAGVSIEVYAIYSELDYPTWKKYIKDNNLTWLNVSAKDHTELGTAKYYYDVYSTPTLYVLDKNKSIFGKRLDVTGLKGFLDHRISEDKKKKG
jgi:thiol-disulfide isomerase/thioredoxin